MGNATGKRYCESISVARQRAAKAKIRTEYLKGASMPFCLNTTMIEHYLPPTFPLRAELRDADIQACAKTWAMLTEGTCEGIVKYRETSHDNRSPIVLLYDEFFFRLFRRARVFEEIFWDMAKRGEVMLKAVGFLLRLTGSDNIHENTRIYYLGVAHRVKPGLRPWQFSVYASTFMEVIMFWLGKDATSTRARSWTLLFAYLLRRLLQAYLPGKVVPMEYYQNWDSDSVKMIRNTHSMADGLSAGMLSQAEGVDKEESVSMAGEPKTGDMEGECLATVNEGGAESLSKALGDAASTVSVSRKMLRGSNSVATNQVAPV